MFKFTKTLRRTLLASLIVGSIVSTSLGASPFSVKSFIPRTSSQSNSSRSNSSSSSLMNRLQSARKSLPSTNQVTNKVKTFPNGNTGISGKGIGTKVPVKTGNTSSKSIDTSRMRTLNEPRGSTTHVLKDGRSDEMKQKAKEAQEAKENAKKKDRPIKVTGRPKVPTSPVFDPATGTVKDVPITPASKKTKAEQANDIGKARKAEEAKQTPHIPAGNRVDRREVREGAGSLLSNIASRIPMGSNGGMGGFDGGAVMVPQEDFIPVMQAAPVQAAPVQMASAQEVVMPVASRTSGAPDLTLTAVKMLAKATDLAGPGYGVAFRNQGTAATQGFKLAAIISDDGQVHADSKKTILEVPGLAPGEVRKMKFRLPRGTSKYMIMILDVDGSVSESDKENNVAMIERAE